MPRTEMLELRNNTLLMLIKYIQAQPETHRNGYRITLQVASCQLHSTVLNELTTCPRLSFSMGSGWDQVSLVNIGLLAKSYSSNLKLSQFSTEPCVQPPICGRICSGQTKKSPFTSCCKYMP